MGIVHPNWNREMLAHHGQPRDLVLLDKPLFMLIIPSTLPKRQLFRGGKRRIASVAPAPILALWELKYRPSWAALQNQTRSQLKCRHSPERCNSEHEIRNP